MRSVPTLPGQCEIFEAIERLRLHRSTISLQFCAERIFTPLHMTHTHFHQDLTQLVPGRAYSYANKGAGFAAAPLNYATVGATSLFTSASDLALWLDNFRDPKVGGAAGVARMQEEGVLSDGTKIKYGLGIALESYRGLKTISHGGGDAGYRSEVVWFPEQELGVVVLSNLGSLNPDRMAKSVAEVYVGDKMAPQETKQSGTEPTTRTASGWPRPFLLQGNTGRLRVFAAGTQSWSSAVGAPRVLLRCDLTKTRCDLAHTPPTFAANTAFLCGSVFSLMVTKQVGCGDKWTPICTHDTTAAQSDRRLAGAQ